ncbi:hypothetical protein L3Y34_009856 [Caenorhabditis briggsae]|uniref:Uncharacterized protein n=1 Tax=Caenorhabditis briggsae TaxID=6238 RepID=A0AAE9A3L9_CAEBR|nr:hypothetical protein L3Y34_009856 [Caenorhabditis briggsae]
MQNDAVEEILRTGSYVELTLWVQIVEKAEKIVVDKIKENLEENANKFKSIQLPTYTLPLILWVLRITGICQTDSCNGFFGIEENAYFGFRGPGYYYKFDEAKTAAWSYNLCFEVTLDMIYSKKTSAKIEVLMKKAEEEQTQIPHTVIQDRFELLVRECAAHGHVNIPLI